MIDTELRFSKHVGEITHLLGGRAYMINQISHNLADAGLIPGLRAAWFVGADGDGAKPDYDCDNIVSLTVTRDGTTEISMGSLFEPVEESTRLYALLGDCAYYEIECTIGGDMTICPRFSSSDNRVARTWCKEIGTATPGSSTTQILQCTTSTDFSVVGDSLSTTEVS